jgi:DNA-binding CsgD family transcriptional regulator
MDGWLKDALKQGSDRRTSDRDSDTLFDLTPRQREVLGLVAQSKSMKEIAHILDIPQRNLEFHKNSVIRQSGTKAKDTASIDQPNTLQRLLCRSASRVGYDSLAGDLEEGYILRAKKSGRQAANRWFWKQVILTTINLAFSALTKAFSPAMKRS